MRRVPQISLNKELHFVVRALLIVLAVICQCALVATHGENAGNWLTFVSVLMLALLVLGVWGWKISSGSVFDLFCIVGAAEVAFNGTQFLMYAVGIVNRENILDTWACIGSFKDECLVEAGGLVLTSLAMYFAGGNLASAQVFPKTRDGDSETLSARLRWMSFFGLACFAIGAVPFAMIDGQNIINAFRFGYSTIYEKDITQNIYNTLAFLLEPGLLLLLIVATYRKKRKVRLLLIAIVFTLAAAFLISGIRTRGVELLLALALTQHRLWKKLKMRYLLLLTPLLLALLAVLGVVRVMENSRDSVATEMAGKGVSSLANNALVEMGGSAGAVVGILHLVPDQRPFEYGLTYANALAAAVPNFYTAGQNPFAEKAQNAKWLTFTLDPATYAVGGGFGFSNIAEAYLNFGVYGCLLFLVYGFVMGHISKRSMSGTEPWAVYLEVVLVLCLPKWARGDMCDLARYVCSVVIFPGLMYIFVQPLVTFAKRPKFGKSSIKDKTKEKDCGASKSGEYS